MNDQEIELLIQFVNGHLWPCICHKPRAKESDLLCAECWNEIPEAKRRGFERLDIGDEKYLAAQQIIRIAESNLKSKQQ